MWIGLFSELLHSLKVQTYLKQLAIKIGISETLRKDASYES